jgi:hypothetical protein
MATTTNYSWVTPDDTSLVKDGAAAIRTLGSSIDTTTKALNPSTTLGDIEYRSATANTNTRLGIGTSGQVLAVSGGVPAWVTSSSGGMTLLSTTALTGASVTLSSIDQTYTDLFLYIYGVTNATSNGQVGVKPNNATSNVYTYLDSTISASSASTIYLNKGDLLRTDADNAFSITFNQYANTNCNKTFSMQSAFLNNSSVRTATIGGGQYRSNTAITSIVINNYGGDLSTGTALLYGVK